MSKTLMIQGTCSNAGKSLIAAGLCRLFARKGMHIAPFKSQNMALNSFVTADNREMGRAQVTQAYACFKEPDVRMNPVLLKPSSETGSQVIVEGIARKVMNFTEYRSMKDELKSVIDSCLTQLLDENDLVIIEGAGSPAEINLKADEIVNMYIAKRITSPVFLVGDIDRGGVFAHFVGTYELLDQEEKDLLKGFIVNKFRGDASLLKPAIDFVEQRTGVPVVGVVPMLTDIVIPEEDSVSFKQQVGARRFKPDYTINIALVDLQHISNFTDFDPFLYEDDVNMYTVNSPEKIEGADLIIIPGSKNVIGDMKLLREQGFAGIIRSKAAEGVMVAGICGGYQMLGTSIEDPFYLESRSSSVKGLQLLNLATALAKDKQLSQTTASVAGQSFPVSGYEIHHGKTASTELPFVTTERGEVIGVRNENVWGTYLHGIFDNTLFRDMILNEIRVSKGKNRRVSTNEHLLTHELDRLADHLEASLDITRICQLAGIDYDND